MKKIWFAALILLTWYLAAMFRSDALLVSAVFEMLIFLSMPVCVHYLKRNMKFGFGQRCLAVNRGEYVECPVWAENTGRLPVSRFQIRVSYCYEGEAAGSYVTFSGNIDKKKKDRVWVRILTPWNGKLSVRVEKVIIYDYFSLFRSVQGCGAEMTAALLPPEGGTGITSGISAVLPEDMQSEMPKKGTYGDEFVQLREYVRGDSYRYIHWKQSARTDILWVKEYQETEQKSMCICLEFGGTGTKSTGEISAFYEILWFLVFCFMNSGFLVKLCWKDRAGTDISRFTGDETAAAAVFEELYEMDWAEKEETPPSLPDESRAAKDIGYGMPSGHGMEDGGTAFAHGMEEDAAFCFGLDLRLFFGGEELICFTPEHFKEEWEGMTV